VKTWTTILLAHYITKPD